MVNNSFVGCTVMNPVFAFKYKDKSASYYTPLLAQGAYQEGLLAVLLPWLSNLLLVTIRNLRSTLEKW